MRTWRDSGPEERLEGKASCFRVISRFVVFSFFVGSLIFRESDRETENALSSRTLIYDRMAKVLIHFGC